MLCSQKIMIYVYFFKYLYPFWLHIFKVILLICDIKLQLLLLWFLITSWYLKTQERTRWSSLLFTNDRKMVRIIVFPKRLTSGFCKLFWNTIVLVPSYQKRIVLPWLSTSWLCVSKTYSLIEKSTIRMTISNSIKILFVFPRNFFILYEKICFFSNFDYTYIYE